MDWRIQRGIRELGKKESFFFLDDPSSNRKHTQNTKESKKKGQPLLLTKRITSLSLKMSQVPNSSLFEKYIYPYLKRGSVDDGECPVAGMPRNSIFCNSWRVLMAGLLKNMKVTNAVETGSDINNLYEQIQTDVNPVIEELQTQLRKMSSVTESRGAWSEPSVGATIAANSPPDEWMDIQNGRGSKPIFGARLGTNTGVTTDPLSAVKKTPDAVTGNPNPPPSVPVPPLSDEEKAAKQYFDKYLLSKEKFENRQKETNKEEILKRFETSLQEKQVSGLWAEMTNIEGVEPTKGAFLGLYWPNAPKNMKRGTWPWWSYYAVRYLILLLAIICIVVCVAFLFTSTSDQVQWSAAFVLMTVIVVLVTMIITHWMNKKFAEQMVERYKDFQKAVYDDLKICEEQMEKQSRA